MTTDPLHCTIDDLADEPPSVFTNARIVGEGVSYADYSKQSALRGQPEYVMSRTDLVEFDVCPARWRNGYRDEGSRSTKWGQLMDALVLCGGFAGHVAVCPETYPTDKGAKPWNFNATYCQDWRELQGEKLIVKAHEAEEAKEALERLMEDGTIFELHDYARKQVHVVGEYQDAETGVTVLVRSLIDILPTRFLTNALIDLKTCGSAHPRAWAKSVFDYDLHTQGALYLDLYNAATGEQRDEFRQILQESFKPWQVAKRILSAEFISLGRAKYQRILKRYAACLKSGQWPGYDEGGPHDVVIDGWLVTQPIDWMNLV